MDSDYQYHVYGDYNCDEDGDHYYDTNGHYDNGNSWHDDSEGYPDEECGNRDVFEEKTEEEPQDPTDMTTFFEGASNFIIDGGSFVSTRGDSYADFEWESEPPRPPPIRSPPSPSKSDFFKGTSTFVISGGHFDTPRGASPISPRPNAKKRVEDFRTLQESAKLKPSRSQKRYSNQGFPDRRPPKLYNKPVDSGRYQSHEFSSRFTPTFPEPDIQIMSIPVPSFDHDSSYPQNDTGIVFPTPDHQTTPNMPAPILFPQTVLSQAPSRSLCKRQGNFKDQDPVIIRKRNRPTTSKTLKSEQGNTKITLDAQLGSTTAKLAKLSLNAFRKRSSQTADRRVGVDDQSSQFSMPLPRGAVDPSADWRSPSPSLLSKSYDDDDGVHVKEPHNLNTQSPLVASVSHGKRVLGPQPPPFAMPQPATIRDPSLFPKPQQG